MTAGGFFLAAGVLLLFVVGIVAWEIWRSRSDSKPLPRDGKGEG